MEESDFKKLRQKMVSVQIVGRGIKNKKILQAFINVSRHLFVPDSQKEFAYDDSPLPIGEGQTISQPYIVALMTEALGINEGMSVLEVGLGSGYQAAILSYLGAKVYSIERIPFLAKKAKETLDSLGYDVKIKAGDGTCGWLQEFLYDRIIVTAAAISVPEPLIEQLKLGGKIVIPTGGRFHQNLDKITKISEGNLDKKHICGCVFVPLVGKHGGYEYF